MQFINWLYLISGRLWQENEICYAIMRSENDLFVKIESNWT